MSKPEITVTEWISDDAVGDRKVVLGGLGGFFKPPMRGQKDFFDNVNEEYKPYVEALRKEIIAKNIRFTGQEHQTAEDGVPVFSDGSVAQFSMRAWGDFLAGTWSEHEDKDYHYMDFYC